MFYKLIGLLFAGGGVFSWFSREIVKAWVLDRVLHVMNPYLAVPLALVVEYAPPAALGGTALYLLAGPEKRHAITYWARTKLNIHLVVAGCAVLVAIGALIMYWADWARGPVRWVLDSPGSPIQFWRPSDAGIAVSGFHIIGTSTSDYPVPIKAAFIRSDITNEIVPFKFGIPGGELQASDATIEPHGKLIMIGTIKATDEERKRGLSLDRFRKEFGRFTFIFEYGDGRKFEKSFSEPEVESLIAKADREQTALRSKPAGVVRTTR
jgi:hypothetical protein